ncbi:MAG: thiamine biosynthesis protein ThiF [Ferruginibacter sp.]|uniref:HesA/MoeB/ThiF family protein n=1 Tax=Ferruginibacter sp. TaxID=1940288 RepID=UPI00265B2BF7|nr:HesA/MoeB/ThiF family protein [Ferruginibacter sp.]MDB5280655.1 thiamine biosynthesis protein ThiF [Ferruginibacter sp.]
MADFTIEEIKRYSRQLMLEEVGAEGQIKIKQAKVLVIGAGGLGCPVLQYLAAAGVGTIGIIDFDKVEIHNLHRQILYTAEDIGKYKAPAAAQKINASNPNVSCIVFKERLEESNAANIIAQFDIVVDGSDNFLTRYLVNDVCLQLNKLLVYGSILKFEGQLAVFNYKDSKNLRDIYPEPPNPEDVPSCSEIGVLGFVPGIIGIYMAGTTIQIILDKYSNDGLLLFNFLEFSMIKINIAA